jgi:hypothetical protein
MFLSFRSRSKSRPGNARKERSKKSSPKEEKCGRIPRVDRAEEKKFRSPTEIK